MMKMPMDIGPGDSLHEQAVDLRGSKEGKKACEETSSSKVLRVVWTSSPTVLGREG